MMIYQQTMLDTTIEPIVPAHAASRNGTKQRQPRTVMFCSSTKANDAPRERSALKRRASSSVPIPDAMFRSPSELQLSVDEQVADERDFVFYARLVSGIRERTRAAHPQHCEQNNSHYYNEETERCLTHIMQTRHQLQQQDFEEDGVPILREEECTGGYYLDDLDCLTSSSSSYSSSSTYQQDFEQDRNDDTCYEEDECIFDLEL